MRSGDWCVRVWGESEIRERMLAEYDVEPDRLSRDVTAFLGELQENRLIRPHPST